MDASEERLNFMWVYSDSNNSNYYNVKKLKKYNNDGKDSDDIYE